MVFEFKNFLQKIEHRLQNTDASALAQDEEAMLDARYTRRSQLRGKLDTLTFTQAMRTAVDRVYLSDAVCEYIVRLIGATREHPLIVQVASPRATLAVAAMSRAAAFVRGRDYVTPNDVRLVFADTISHRLLLSPRGESGEVGSPVQAILKGVQPPAIQ